MLALHTHYAEGWLTKRGAVNTSWKLRWFVLRNRALSYYKKKTVRAVCRPLWRPRLCVSVCVCVCLCVCVCVCQCQCSRMDGEARGPCVCVCRHGCALLLRPLSEIACTG
jgi:hypothetical protein